MPKDNTQKEKPEKDEPEEKKPEEEPKEEKPSEKSPGEKPLKGDLTSPTAVVMFICAGLLDGISLILLCFALDDFWILDSLGMIFISTLMFFHSGALEVIRKEKKDSKGKIKGLIKKVLKKTILNWGFVAKLVPYLGALYPHWTVTVWKHLRNS